ncbi:MAG TPA: hypothetical protein VGQ11_10150 [Candidatus Acidoferrales bacterium]|nr:hypothetical protein [Candidatus Acidoferrales bacterium]
MWELLKRALIEPFSRLNLELGKVLPALLTIAIILLIGCALAIIVRRVTTTVLRWVRFDHMVEGTTFGTAVESSRLLPSPSEFVGRMAQGFVWLVTILFALSAADTQVTQSLVTRFFDYIPDMITAVLVLLLAVAVSKFLARSVLLAAVNAQWPAAKFIAGGVRVLVMSLGVLVALEQLRIGRTALLVAFAILFAGVVIAAAIAFGLAARDLAKDWLRSRMPPTQPREEEQEEVFRHL